MGWHESYLAQARSDYAIVLKLNHPEVEYCHRLHYLQMVTEKLAKAMLTPAGSSQAAPMTHAMFVRMLRVLKARPEIRRRLGYQDSSVFRSYIDSLLEMAERIQRLAPGEAGLSQPNPEYPWQNARTGNVVAPAEYPFVEFDPRNPKMVKIDGLIKDLLKYLV